MDHFGIGAAIYGAARVYFQSARRTGRTTALLDGLKDGDRLVVEGIQKIKPGKPAEVLNTDASAPAKPEAAAPAQPSGK